MGLQLFQFAGFLMGGFGLFRFGSTGWGALGGSNIFVFVFGLSFAFGGVGRRQFRAPRVLEGGVSCLFSSLASVVVAARQGPTRGMKLGGGRVVHAFLVSIGHLEGFDLLDARVRSKGSQRGPQIFNRRIVQIGIHGSIVQRQDIAAMIVGIGIGVVGRSRGGPIGRGQAPIAPLACHTGTW